jgi:hypothetical protein
VTLAKIKKEIEAKHIQFLVGIIKHKRTNLSRILMTLSISERIPEKDACRAITPVRIFTPVPELLNGRADDGSSRDPRCLGTYGKDRGGGDSRIALTNQRAIDYHFQIC